MNNSEFFRQAAGRGRGVLRLAPTWFPRDIAKPAGRLRLHPSDLYAAGPQNGGIAERWIAANTSQVEWNGELAPLGEFTAVKSHCKLVDNSVAAPFQLHAEKHKACWYPQQYNTNPGRFPFAFYGLQPHTTRNMIRRCLERWNEGDNGILHHSQAYKLKPNTGWQIDANVLHAPGTLVSYEPQTLAEEEAVFESQCDGDPLPWEALIQSIPEQHRYDLDYILSLIDFEKNTDPFFSQFNFREPIRAEAGDTHIERWVVYGSPHFSARELSVAPGATVTTKDPLPYGALVVQGRGSINGLDCEVPSIVRYGQMTADEFYVTAAEVTITNASQIEPLVILKNFGSGHPAAGEFIECKSE
ncbi:MAG: hypothetical protein HYX27_17755 [Acidobacteria bacterium]|nr:hypothetical protein [Acidobacteriota bacterium]